MVQSSEFKVSLFKDIPKKKVKNPINQILHPNIYIRVIRV